MIRRIQTVHLLTPNVALLHRLAKRAVALLFQTSLLLVDVHQVLSTVALGRYKVSKRFFIVTYMYVASST